MVEVELGLVGEEHQGVLEWHSMPQYGNLVMAGCNVNWVGINESGDCGAPEVEVVPGFRHDAVLIGQDTRSKHKYVRWEMEVAREKGCRIIGINLDGSRRVVDATCPPIIRNIGAIFVPFSPKIVAYALENYQMHENDDYHYKDKVYKQLGFK